MTVPFREWTFPAIHRSLYALDPDSHNYNQATDWTTTPINYAKVGEGHPGAASYEIWRAIFRGDDPTFILTDGMDEVVDYGVEVVIAKDVFGTDKDNTRLQFYIFDYPDGAAAIWDSNLVSGRFYDGINQWDAFPQDLDYPYTNYYTLIFAGFTSAIVSRYAASYAAGAAQSNVSQERFFDNGICIYNTLFYKGGGPAALLVGEEYSAQITCNRLEARFFNPVVNSLSSYRLLATGGESLVLTGLGFDNDDAELSDATRSTYNIIPPGGWDDEVDFIYIINSRTGAIAATLSRALGDFTINSNSQITISSMPALARGLYWLYLEKRNVMGIANDIFAYAGDWRCYSDGRVYDGTRFILEIYELGDAPTPPDEPPIPLTEWEFTHLGVSIFKYLAPIDIRSPNRFYDGYILNVSSLKRSVNDRTGLFSVSDMTLDLANDDMEWSEMMARYMMKNAFVNLFHAYRSVPEVLKADVHRMIIDDYELEGNKFRVFLKDITRRYFDIKAPEYLVTLEEYPDAHEDAVGEAVPEIIGLTTLTGDEPGSIVAPYVDTVNWSYIASRGSLNSVPQVYVEGALQTAGVDYNIAYRDGGRTYIDFLADQGDDTVTFNAAGYMFAPWNSANGYVQSPSYVLLFALSFIFHIPVELIDMESFNDLHDYFVDQGFNENAKFVFTSPEKADNSLSKYLFTWGIKLFPGNDGRLKAEIKDTSNFQTDEYIHEQIDCMEPARNMPTLRKAINYCRYKWDFHPAADLYLGANSQESATSIVDLGATIEASDSPWEFPWTDSEDWVRLRVENELLKRGYGDRQISLRIPLARSSDFDVHDNFRFQSLFAPSITRSGQAGWYYYIKSIEYNWSGAEASIEAVDLQWLVRQCMIIGKYAELTRDWATANDMQRMFAYIGRCVEGTFEDGEPNKKICDCY